MAENCGKLSDRRRLGFRKACFTCRKQKHRCDGQRPRCFSCRNRGLYCEYLDKLVKPSLERCDGVGGPDATRINSECTTQASFHSTETNPTFLRDAAVSNGLNDIETSDQNLILSSQNKGRGTYVPSAPFGSPQANLTKAPGYVGHVVGATPTPKIALQGRPKLQAIGSETQSFEKILNPRISTVPGRWNSPPILWGESLGHDELPPQRIANALVDAYFERVHILYPFLHEGSFRTRYEQIWSTSEPSKPRETSWMALISLVFAHGSEFYMTSPAVQSDQHASKFVEHAKKLILAVVFRTADLTLVQALLLLCHHMQGTLSLNECWHFSGLMMRSAIHIGLNVSMASHESMLPVERESRKRLWWGCLVFERTLCMKLGRSPSIRHTDAHKVALPLEVDDQYIVDEPLVPRQPSSRPSRMSFFVQTIKLSHLIDRILAKLYLASIGAEEGQSHDAVSYQQDENFIVGHAFLLDGELQTWWKELPPHLREDPSIPDGIDFQRQRCVTRIRFLQVRLLLQRPSFTLFNRAQVQDKFMEAGAAASSRACIVAAEETIRLIHGNYDCQLLNALWYSVHYIFTSLAVLVTVRTMTNMSSNSLSQLPESVIFDRGMNFLRAASSNSPLASQYLTLLEEPRYQEPAVSEVANLKTQHMAGMPQNKETSHIREPIEELSGQVCVPETNAAQFELHEDIDYSTIDSLDSIFEIGLPISTSEWPWLNSSL